MIDGLVTDVGVAGTVVGLDPPPEVGLAVGVATGQLPIKPNIHMPPLVGVAVGFTNVGVAVGTRVGVGVEVPEPSGTHLNPDESQL